MIINGSEYVRASAFTSEVDANGNYSILIKQKVPNTNVISTLYIPEQFLDLSVINPAYNRFAVYGKVKCLSGEFSSDYRVHYVQVSGLVSAYYKSETLALTAIVPVKENNVLVDLDTYKMRRMLTKLNLSEEDLIDSISNTDMDSAYLLMGIDPQFDDDETNEVLFKMFNATNEGVNTINGSYSSYKVTYQFDLRKVKADGVAGEVGSYTRINSGEGEDSLIVLRYQISADTFKELIITNFSQITTLSGASFTSYLDSSDGYTRLLIPLDILNSLTFYTWAKVYEQSLCILAFSTETVEVKWYETGAFGTLLKIAAIVITIVSLGTATSLSAALWTMATVMAISMAASYIAQEIGGTFGMIVGAIAAVAAMYAAGFYDPNSTAMFWLQSANTALSVVNQSLAHEMENVINAGEAALEALKEKQEDLQEKIEEAGYNESSYSLMQSFDPSYAGKANPVFRSIEAYCDSIVGNNGVEPLMDYGQQIDYALLTHTNVTTGLS